MALIKTVPPDAAEGKLAELYKGSEEFFGWVPNNVRLLGVNPDILANQFDFVMPYLEHPTLRQPFLRCLRMLVSHRTNSPYCDNLNAGLMQQEGVTPAQIDETRADPSRAPLPDREKALLLFVLQAIEDPHGVGKEHITELGEMGWSERDIFDAVAHGARAVYVNILFDAFQVEQD